MDINSSNIEAIVRQVLSDMKGTKTPASSVSGGSIPSTAHVAMLTELEKFEVKEYPMPQVGDDDILV